MRLCQPFSLRKGKMAFNRSSFFFFFDTPYQVYICIYILLKEKIHFSGEIDQKAYCYDRGTRKEGFCMYGKSSGLSYVDQRDQRGWLLVLVLVR